MYVVGLTGGIGSGKSTVARLFAGLGVPVVDADQAARTVVLPGSAGLREVEQAFGPEALLPDGSLDRAAMRRRVFADAQERLRLEAITHPRIQKEVQRQLAAAAGEYALFVSPLLLETGQVRLADRILAVDVPEEMQISRVVQRDGEDRQQVQSIMKAQVPRAVRLKRADDVLDNSRTQQQLAAAVERLHRRYLRLAAGGGG